MGNVPSENVDQRRSRRKFTICESLELKNGTSALFVTEPKCKDVRMYHVYKVIGLGSNGQAKDIAIIDYVNVCTNISFVKRSNVDGIMWNTLHVKSMEKWTTLSNTLTNNPICK